MPRGPRPPLIQLNGDALAQTLIPSLTPVRDAIFDLRTRFGAQPYEVFLVRTQWSGGRRNSGTESVLSVTPLLPVPTVQALDTMIRTLQTIGIDEVGAVRVTDISPAYSEDELVGLGPQGQPISADQSFFWEIQYPRPLPDQSVRRRYVARSAPSYDPTNFRWSIVLDKASENRQRSGVPGGGNP
jgi:hypothetical protein